MASDINYIMLTGRLGGDPEFNKVGEADLAEFSLAVTQYRGPNRESDTGWWKCTLWGSRSKVAEYLSTGMKVTVIGKVMQDTSEKDGQKRRWYKIDVMDLTLPDKPSQTGGERIKSRANSPDPNDPDDGLPF